MVTIFYCRGFRPACRWGQLLRKLAAAGILGFVVVDAVLCTLGRFHRLVIQTTTWRFACVGGVPAGGFDRFVGRSCSGFGGIQATCHLFTSQELKMDER